MTCACGHEWSHHYDEGCCHHTAGRICPCTRLPPQESTTMSIKGPSGQTNASLIFSSITVLKVDADSTGPRGGDAGHGSTSRLSLKDLAGMCWTVTIVDHDGSVHEFEPQSVDITVRGDDEQGQLLAALTLGRDVLMRSGVEATEPCHDYDV
jgi:hypothetical protein